jgi:hypothetical protein
MAPRSMRWLPAEGPSPALLVRPLAAASLDEAHLAIEQWEHYSRKTLDNAQRVAVELMMAEGAGGRWAARTTARTEPRQNGKGDELEVVEAWGLTQRGEAIVHTAHEIPTAKKAHERMVAHLESHLDLRRKIRGRPTYGNGNFGLKTTNGGEVVYRTRTAGGARGLDDISRLVVDEAQHAQLEQLASSAPTLAANPNPQMNLTGSAGIAGRSDWWWTIRKRALTGDGDEFAYLEHSAERVELNRDGRPVSTPPDPQDRAAWAKANPAYGIRIDEGFLKDALHILGADLFAREHLGVWDPCNDGEGFLPFGKWLAASDVGSTVSSGLCYGLSVAPDGSWAAVASAGRRRDGRLHVDSVRYERGTGWVVDYLADLYGRKRVAVRVNPEATEGAFIRSLSDRKVGTVEVGHREYKQACGAFLAALENDGLRHLDQESLNRSVASVVRRDVGHEGGWVWERPTVDVSPLVAVTLALSGVAEARRPKIHVLQEV